MSLVFDEYGRPFIIIKDQGSKSRLKGIAALKVPRLSAPRAPARSPHPATSRARPSCLMGRSVSGLRQCGGRAQQQHPTKPARAQLQGRPRPAFARLVLGGRARIVPASAGTALGVQRPAVWPRAARVQHADGVRGGHRPTSWRRAPWQARCAPRWVPKAWTKFW